mgnify:CR=1 FL=1
MELFGGASDWSPSGIEGLSGIETLAQAQSDFNTGSDEQAQSNIASVLANVGNRSNVRGTENYDPIFAQALAMSRGLLPGNRVAGDYYGADKFKGMPDLARPSYLNPQIRGADGTMYHSGGERFLQETLPPFIQQIRKASPTGIIQTLIEQGQNVYEKGKGVLENTFGDEKKSDAGIMQNMDRADMSDLQKALIYGYENNPYSEPNQGTQTADLNLKELLKTGTLGNVLGYSEPFVQEMLPEGVNFDAGLIYDPEKPDDSYTGIKFTIPFSTG